MNALNELITINQGILYALHVSHPTLNTIANVAQEYGLACKITGGGGGGCCFILLGAGGESYLTEEKQNELCQVLTHKKFSSFETQLGCMGLSVS